jgi:hypothetical protein
MKLKQLGLTVICILVAGFVAAWQSLRSTHQAPKDFIKPIAIEAVDNTVVVLDTRSESTLKVPSAEQKQTQNYSSRDYLRNARKILSKTDNYRALVHSALITKYPDELDAAFLAAHGECPFVTIVNSDSDLRERLHSLTGAMAAQWNKTQRSCLASGGIDTQQRRALVAVLESTRPDWYVLRQNLKPDLKSQELIANLNDSNLAFEWFSKMIQTDPVLIFGVSSILANIPHKLASTLMQLEYCVAHECYSIEGQLFNCAMTGACTNNYSVSVLLESLPDAFRQDNHPARIAARERVTFFFP